MTEPVWIAAAVGAGVLVLGGIAVAVVLSSTRGLVSAAHAFFSAVARGDGAAARSQLSEAFLASSSDEALAAFLARRALSSYQSASWHSRKVARGTGSLEGKITTASGGVVPVEISFVKERGGWKILALREVPAGVLSDAPAAPIPSRSEAAALASETTRDFAQAVKVKDLASFWSTRSRQLREQVSLSQFTQAFDAFVEREIDLSPVAAVAPFFTAEPAVSADGVLRVQGYFPGQGGRVEFAYHYVHPEHDWELLGIELSIRPDGS